MAAGPVDPCWVMLLRGPSWDSYESFGMPVLPTMVESTLNVRNCWAKPFLGPLSLREPKCTTHDIIVSFSTASHSRNILFTDNWSLTESILRVIHLRTRGHVWVFQIAMAHFIKLLYHIYIYIYMYIYIHIILYIYILQPNFTVIWVNGVT